jgi:uncharacterized protein (DUF2225 family)
MKRIIGTIILVFNLLIIIPNLDDIIYSLEDPPSLHFENLIPLFIFIYLPIFSLFYIFKSKFWKINSSVEKNLERENKIIELKIENKELESILGE